MTYETYQIEKGCKRLETNSLFCIQNLTKLILKYEIDNLGSFLYIQGKFFLSKIFSILDEILSKKYELKINLFNYKPDHVYALWTNLIIF